MKHSQGLKITIVGAGTIGLSFAASHLLSDYYITIYDTRPNAKEYILETLPALFGTHLSLHLPKLVIATSLEEAVAGAHVIQESGPENLGIKRKLWVEIEKYAPKDALLWSSTSGIPASRQAQDMQDRSRLLVVHPYNPPHIMPLLELVPSPDTSPDVIKRTQQFWHQLGKMPVLIKKEVTGFVANRLAFALLRESIHLVNEGVVSVRDLDHIVESSMGPRWAVAGPFKSYSAGGGSKGLEGLFANVGDTVQSCWDDAGQVTIGDGSGWEKKLFSEVREAYGTVDTEERDRITKRLLDVLEEERGHKGGRKSGAVGDVADE